MRSQGWVPDLIRLVSLKEEIWECSLLFSVFLFHSPWVPKKEFMWEHSEMAATPKMGRILSPETDYASTLILDFLPLELRES